MNEIMLLKDVILLIILRTFQANTFEPYTLHGGLVSAIAGKDYVIIASDTRLSDGGYNILSREHLQSRLWAVSGFFPINSGLFHPDGSVIIPKQDERPPTYSQQPTKMGVLLGKSEVFRDCPIIIASAGCSSDCEALKRQIRGEVNALQNWCYGRNTLTAAGMANLLGQCLYTRRAFPYYSFCVLAGIEKTGHARVHVYDAIGSHERVAIGCAGNGKEMMQPILDRMFSSTVDADDDELASAKDDTGPVKRSLQRDGRAVDASKQRVGLRLEPPVETYVLCDAKKAVGMLIKAYRSVAEREISVGDNVVICIIKRITGKTDYDDVSFSMEVVRSKLKEH